MLHLLRLDSLLRYLVSITVSASTALFYVLRLFFPDLEIYKLVVLSSAIIAAIGFVLLSPTCFRWYWEKARHFNRSLFPDLSGSWSGTIETAEGQTIEVRAVIRQSLISTQLDLHANSTKSITLTASAMFEAGRPMLYYIYRVEPRNPNWHIYTGTTVMNVRVDPNGALGMLSLSGQYFTSRGTRGTVQLTRTGTDPTVDVAFY